MTDSEERTSSRSAKTRVPSSANEPLHSVRQTPATALAPHMSRSEISPKPLHTKPPELSAPKEVILQITGNRVALRGGPGTNHPVLDRYDKGRTVILLEEGPKWSSVRDRLTQRQGWVANFLLAPETHGQPQQSPAPKTQQPVRTGSKSHLSDAEIAKRIIARSLANYPGSCPCPYNTDRGGRRCGKRSAYSRPGGYAPICYPGDVTRQMILSYRGG